MDMENVVERQMIGAKKCKVFGSRINHPVAQPLVTWRLHDKLTWQKMKHFGKILIFRVHGVCFCQSFVPVACQVSII